MEQEAETGSLDAMAPFGAESTETFVAKQHLEVVRRFTSTHEWCTHQ